MRDREPWNLDDESGWQAEEVVAPRRPTSRRLMEWGVIAALAAGVIVLARNSEAPQQQRPTQEATPVATPSLEGLQQVVERESMALARRERDAFIATQDPEDVRWLESQESFFDRWETPSFEGVPYFVIDMGLLPGDRAWVDLRQLRRGGYLRETRFYRLGTEGRWKRTRPVLAFWGRQRALDTVHFHAVFADGDAEVVQYTLARFEAAYSRLCADLGCDIRPEQSTRYGVPPEWYSPYPISYSPYPRVTPITLLMRPEVDRLSWDVLDSGYAVTITMPSPRVSGVVDSWLGQIDASDLTIADSLVLPVARIASGGMERLGPRQDGQLFFDAIVAWERDAIRPLTPERLRYMPSYGQFDEADLFPPEVLWSGPPGSAADAARAARMREQALSMVVFIGQEYGSWGIGTFTGALGSSRSLAGAIRSSIRLEWPEFERQWRAWLSP